MADKGGYLIPAEWIDNAILEIRGRKVMLSHDLAALYGVSTKAFNQAVKRNAERFPEDFMFQLTREEAQALRSQSVTSNETGSRSQSATLNGRPGRGGQREQPAIVREDRFRFSAKDSDFCPSAHASSLLHFLFQPQPGE